MPKFDFVQVFIGVLLVSLNGYWEQPKDKQFSEIVLKRIKDTNPQITILDISSLNNKDILMAQYLVEIIKKIQLLDTRVILTGVNTSVRRLLANNNIEFPDVKTCQFLAEGLWMILDILEPIASPIDR